MCAFSSQFLIFIFCKRLFHTWEVRELPYERMTEFFCSSEKKSKKTQSNSDKLSWPFCMLSLAEFC